MFRKLWNKIRHPFRRPVAAIARNAEKIAVTFTATEGYFHASMLIVSGLSILAFGANPVFAIALFTWAAFDFCILSFLFYSVYFKPRRWTS